MARTPGTYAVFQTSEAPSSAACLKRTLRKRWLTLSILPRANASGHTRYAQEIHRPALPRDGLPSRHSGLHDPGRDPREPAWVVRDTSSRRDQRLSSSLRQIRQTRDGQCRTEHQRFAVLHHCRCTEWLTGKHTIFGEVVEGTISSRRISKAARNRQDRPNKD